MVGESTIEVSMSEAARIGRLDGQIRLETTEPSNPVLTLRAMANVAATSTPSQDASRSAH